MSRKYFTCTEHVVPGQHIRHYARGTSQSQEDELVLAVKHYVPRDVHEPVQPGDVTIIASHASGFPKELYEPLWDHLLRSSAVSSNSFRIRGIWIADAANQNASGVLNERKIGTEPSYFDHARDLLCMVNYFRREMPRPIVGFGHSMGGTVMINLALLHPRLLSGVFSVEPVINKTPQEMNFKGAYGLGFKADVWPSKEEAEVALRKSPIVRSWDDSVLALYLKYGLRETPTLIHDEPGRITTLTTKHQESFAFGRAAYPRRGTPLTFFQPTRTAHPDLDIARQPKDNPFYQPSATQTFAQLPLLAPPLFLLYGSKTHMAAGSPRGQQDKLEVVGTGIGGSGGYAEGRVLSRVIQGGSHFVPFEQPEHVAKLFAEWLTAELKKWGDQEAEEQQARADLSPKQRVMIDEDWTWWLREQYGPAKRKRNAKI